MGKQMKIIRIVLSIFVLMVLGICLYMLFTNKYTEGEVKIKLVDETNEVIDEKTLSYTKNQKLYDIVNINYELNYSNGIIYRIGALQCNDNQVISIYINDDKAIYTMQNIVLNDDDVISFILMEIS